MTMELLRIRRFKARYHLAPSRQHERARLDQLLRLVLGEALERALERAGVSPYEEVCIRNLHVPVRLSLAAPDSSLVLAWSLALAESIVRARDGAYLPGVVRYSSPIHALLDLALGIASGNYERTWAWRLVGIWSGSEAPSRTEAAYELVRALGREPSAIVAVLTALASPNLPAATCARFAQALSAEQWIELAEAALTAAGISPAVLDGLAVPGVSEIMTQAQRILADALLAHGIAEILAPATRAVAYPVEARGSAEQGTALLEGVETRRALAALLVLAHDPGSLRSPSRGRALVSALADALHPAAVPLRASLAPRQAHSAARQRQTEPPTNAEAPIVIRQRAETRFGGLLFLLGVVEDLGLPEEILARFERRPFRWVLHQLALVLVPAAEHDAAVLAFAGLLPDARPPSLDDEPSTDAEREIVAAFVSRIDTVLGERLEQRPPIPFVCHRRAEIVADPGWIEVQLALDEVSTAIRRAGLDLDPGYVPWLGAVVRFVYA
jgi:hypothetical protein